MGDTIIKNVCYAKEYTERTTGEVKTKWIKIGTQYERDGQIWQNIECIPMDAFKTGELTLMVFNREEGRNG